MSDSAAEYRPFRISLEEATAESNRRAQRFGNTVEMEDPANLDTKTTRFAFFNKPPFPGARRLSPREVDAYLRKETIRLLLRKSEGGRLLLWRGIPLEQIEIVFRPDQLNCLSDSQLSFLGGMAIEMALARGGADRVTIEDLRFMKRCVMSYPTNFREDNETWPPTDLS